MALSERSKLLIAGGVLLATGMLLFGLLRGEPRVTVTFDRYEGETAVLIFKNKSHSHPTG